MSASSLKQNDPVDRILSLQVEHKDTLDFSTNVPRLVFQTGTRCIEIGLVEKKFDESGSSFLLVALLGFYWRHQSESTRKQESYANLLVKFVELYSDTDLAGILYYSHSDDDGFKKVKTAWLKQTQLFPQSVRVASNAAFFLNDLYPAEALVLYERAEQLDSQNPNWQADIGLVCLDMAYNVGRIDHLELTLKSVQSWNKFLSRISTKDIDQNDICLNQILIEEKTLEIAELALSKNLLKEAFELTGRISERPIQIEGDLARISTRDKTHSLLGRINVAESKFVEAQEQLKIMGDFADAILPHSYYELVLANALLNCGFSAAVSDYIQACVRADSSWIENAEADTRKDSSFTHVKDRCQKMTAWLKSLKEGSAAALDLGHSHPGECSLDDTAEAESGQ